MITADEHLERIVAGIQAASSAGAEVTWNEKINGRQFDTVVRFTLGALRYLVVVEVKNRTRRASASDVEAFVTKARDQNANKAVFVTAAGYQSGALKISKQHGIDLFRLEFAEDEVELFSKESVVAIRSGQMAVGYDIPNMDMHIGDPALITQIASATLVYTDGRCIDLPDEPSQMNYYAAKTTLKTGQNIAELIADHVPLLELDQASVFEIPFSRPQLINPPDHHFFPTGKVARIRCKARGVIARELLGDTMIEPSSFRTPVIYTNCLTGEATRYPLDQLPLGLKNAQPGGFYFLMHPLRYYYCDKVVDDLVHWMMIESFQAKSLFRVAYTQKVEYSRHYMPVSNKAVLRRLGSRLAEMRALSDKANNESQIS